MDVSCFSKRPLSFWLPLCSDMFFIVLNESKNAREALVSMVVKAQFVKNRFDSKAYLTLKPRT